MPLLLEAFLIPTFCATLSCFSHVRLFETLWTIAHQAPLSMGFSRQESWSGLPCPPLGVFSTPGSNSYLLCLLHCQADYISPPKVPQTPPPVLPFSALVTTLNVGLHRGLGAGRGQRLSGQSRPPLEGPPGAGELPGASFSVTPRARPHPPYR